MTRFITSLEAGKRFEVDFDEVTFAPRGEYFVQFISYVSYLALVGRLILIMRIGKQYTKK